MTDYKSWRVISSTTALTLFVLTLIWFVLPVLSVIPILFYATRQSIQNSIIGRSFLLFLVSLSFGLIAYTAESVSVKVTDIYRYQELYSSFVNLPLSSVNLKNPLFDLINYLSANYITDNPQFVGLFWTTFTYLFFLLAVNKIISNTNKIDRDWLFIIFVGCILIIPFVWITELIKQSISFSVFAFALAKKLKGEKSASMFCLIGLLLHIPMIIILPIFFYNSKLIARNIIPIFLVSIGLSFFNILDLLSPLAELNIIKKIGLSERIIAYNSGFGFIISKRFYLQLAFYISQILLLILFRINKMVDDELIIVILSLSVLLINMGNSHNFVRLVYVYYPFYSLVMLFTLSSIEKLTNRILVASCTCLFYSISNSIMTYKFLYSTAYSNNYMDNNIVGLLFSNVAQFIRYSIYI